MISRQARPFCGNERGEFGALKTWFSEYVHSHGRRYRAAELCEHMTGKPLSADPFSLNYPDTDSVALDARCGVPESDAAIETEKKALSLLLADAPGRGDYEAALAKFEAALKNESK